jgi:hypothetical protein
MPFHSSPPHRQLCLPKVVVNKFDGSNPMGRITQMEYYFSLHDINDDLAKLHIDFLYLDPECWKWWQWRKNSCRGYVAWTQFVVDIYERFDTETHHLDHFTKMKQSGKMKDYITSFEHLDFKTKGMYDTFFRE